MLLSNREVFLSKRSKLSFFVSPERPSSLDPLLYDYFKHHPVQSMLHCTLTSLYRGTGSVSPELARSWKQERGGTLWKIQLRSDVKFTNGEAVTSEIVERSLKRIFFLLKKQNTKYIFVKKLKGFDGFSGPEDELKGLRAKPIDNEIELEFEEPIPKLSEAISFGHFAIVHPSNYDQKTGEWISADWPSLIGCGPYKVKAVNDDALVLEKRIHFPKDLAAKNGFKEIEMIFKTSEENPADIFLGGPNVDSKLKNTHDFFPNGSRTITYLRVFPWAVKDSIWENRRIRKSIRDVIYKNFAAVGANFSRSFFPTTLNGVAEPLEIDVTSNESISIEGTELDFGDPYSEDYKGPTTLLYKGLMKAFEDLGFKISKKRGIPLEELVKLNDRPKERTLMDVGTFVTGISLEDPESDVRLMFSKEGIDLPDPTGKIAEELKKSKINIQAINQQLYDDAIIWPVSISNRGFWARKDLDLSDYNTLKPLGELQWIGQK